ncbi:hypothetical protein VIBNISOn1_1350001 [Vibrio nigripulchritudo SOn1]|uniref:Uncharacterized protein n=1 Tax=Vibrio nigripulchritudo SOn1 TaxID=1238450 RepID=A0AAV2VK24_9VIBR|nr:hypothetical protein [Vibrio nigripulchritudo]CCO45037.1 hypothetical protein VIBNISOn1_1350001 [Vibrio nigripulchritudo SOn1]
MKIFQFIKSLFANETQKAKLHEFYAPNDIRALALQAQQNYRANPNKLANRKNITAIVNAFHALHSNLSEQPHDNYFFGNLIKDHQNGYTCMDTAVKLTLELIDNPKDLYCAQCDYFSRNLEVILRDYSFKSPPEKIISPYLNEIGDVAYGGI